MALNNEEFERLAQGVYDGTISVFQLPTFLYQRFVELFDKDFFKGFGEVPRGEILEIEKAVNFRANIGRFSGAKTFQEVKDLTNFVFDENGRKRPFAEFKKLAKQISNTYNKNWLEAERDSVFTQSQNARKWIRYEKEAELFPVLEYRTVGDDRVRHSHAELNGLKLPVNHPLWNRVAPQNGWRCRCILIQRREQVVTSERDALGKSKSMLNEFSKEGTFDYNPGKTDFIFREKGKGKHDYFKVPRQFNQQLEINFGFPSVEEVTRKFI